MDITKCINEDCPLSRSCYRFTSEANQFSQAYGLFEPRIIEGLDEYLDEYECDYYIEQG